MAYVDGFVIPIKKSRLKAYRKMAALGKKAWMRHGALAYKECVADDLKAPGMLPFNKLARCRAGETVVFAFITYKSKAHRKQVNARVFKEFSESKEPVEMPFNPARASMGGFKVFVG